LVSQYQEIIKIFFTWKCIKIIYIFLFLKFIFNINIPKQFRNIKKINTRQNKNQFLKKHSTPNAMEYFFGSMDNESWATISVTINWKTGR
jgi:hypothetical protein